MGGGGLEAGRPDLASEKVNHWLVSRSVTSSTISSSSTWAYRPLTGSLALGLTVCFGMSSIAQFGSLLVFSGGQVSGCAFLVAWGAMAGQAARLLGLMRLSLDLKKMGVRKFESVVFWVLLAAALGE